ncbi:glycosyltransferase family 2 protein [Vibrio natriegens]|uniref:glycosyltransferase family 2 protein n=1 Tax=Vibrio natriegens TaxID=691 RepID=UPI001FB8E3FB|nr:glycosyltransferase family 2 protein [Vibrio natriegens]
MLLSVLIAAYNSETYIVDCLKSIVRQMEVYDFNDIELIVIDDGSNDKTLERINSIDKEYCNIRVETQTNLGVTATRRRLLELAQGKYICFVDSDDLVSDNYLPLIMKYINGREFDILDFNLKRFNSEIELNLLPEVSSKCQENYDCNLRQAFMECKWHMCSRVFNANLIKADMFSELMFFEDAAIVPYLYLSSNKLIRTNSCIYFYRNNLQGITKNYTKKHLCSWSLVANKAIKFMNEGFINLTEEKKIYFYQYVHSVNKIYTKAVSRSKFYNNHKQVFITIPTIKLIIKGILPKKDILLVCSPKIYSLLVRKKNEIRKTFNN